MQAPYFDLVSHWHLDAPLGRVWAALAEPETWPRWWPYVRGVHTVRAAGADGVGGVRRIDWRTPLPYRFTIEIESVEVRRHERLRGRARGDLQGEGVWLLRSDGRFTDVTYVWRVTLRKRWMVWLAPLLAAAFRWNHAVVMRSGGQGLARHLARP